MIRTAYYTKMDFEPCEAGVLGIVVEFEETDLPDTFKVYIAEGLYLDFERWSSDRTYRATTPSAWNVHRDEIQPIRRDSGRKATKADPHGPKGGGTDGTALERYLEAARRRSEGLDRATLVGFMPLRIGRYASSSEPLDRLDRETARLLRAALFDIPGSASSIEPEGLSLNFDVLCDHLNSLSKTDDGKEAFLDRSAKDAVKGETGLEGLSNERSARWVELWVEGMPHGYMIPAESLSEPRLNEFRALAEQVLSGKIAFREYEIRFIDLTSSWRDA